jgi:predicted Zn-dependent protease
MLLPAHAAAGPAVLKLDKNRYPVVGNTELQLYADRLGSRLLPSFWKAPEAAQRHGYSFWFVVVVHNRAQASAFPSGVVVIHTGLLRLVENEAQLAFVIAHEIAHVTQEHAWREYLYHRRKLLFLRWSTAGLGYVVESAIRRGYQRDLEEQADRLALWYMTRAGYDPREGLRLLRRLEENQEGLSALLWDTHRSYGRRRKTLMGELARYSRAGLQYDGLTKNSPEFVSLRAEIPTARIKKAETVE